MMAERSLNQAHRADGLESCPVVLKFYHRGWTIGNQYTRKRILWLARLREKAELESREQGLRWPRTASLKMFREELCELTGCTRHDWKRESR